MKLSGEEQKQLGMDLVQEHNPDFVNIVRDYALAYAADHGTVSADELRVWARDEGIVPRHPNAWGCVFRGKSFKKVGYRPSVYPPSHGRVIAIWAISSSLSSPSSSSPVS